VKFAGQAEVLAERLAVEELRAAGRVGVVRAVELEGQNQAVGVTD